jgi:HSP20 family protein
MAEAATKLPVKAETPNKAPARPDWQPFDTLRREVDRLFDEFRWRSPFGRAAFDLEQFWRGELTWGKNPAVDIVDKGSNFEITAELPGMDPGNINVMFSDGTLTIKGEKKEEREEKKDHCHLSERRYGTFQRSFGVPNGVNAEKIEASFKNGVLTVVLPKSADAQKAAKKIEIKAD